jgi:hypothetical protein
VSAFRFIVRVLHFLIQPSRITKACANPPGKRTSAPKGKSEDVHGNEGDDRNQQPQDSFSAEGPPVFESLFWRRWFSSFLRTISL